MTRAALAASGFTRMESDGTVWFESTEMGSDPTCVLLHGANDQAGTWFAVAAALAQRFRDPARSSGQSERGGRSRSRDRRSRHSDSPRKPFTLGNSLGGWIATLVTLRHPERVRN
jgi:pimeloyl-ACP methyl ester carboxylesterase